MENLTSSWRKKTCKLVILSMQMKLTKQTNCKLAINETEKVKFAKANKFKLSLS